jgi:hypothetical protein
MTFGQMRQQDEAVEQHDFAFNNDIADLPTDLVIPTNPSAGHQDEPVDPVTE